VFPQASGTFHLWQVQDSNMGPLSLTAGQLRSRRLDSRWR
jgi:hypothetical protein